MTFWYLTNIRMVCIFYLIDNFTIRKERKMVNKKNWLGMLVMVLVFGVIVVSCASGPSSGGQASGSLSSYSYNALDGPSGSWAYDWGQEMPMTSTYIIEGALKGRSYSLTHTNTETGETVIEETGTWTQRSGYN